MAERPRDGNAALEENDDVAANNEEVPELSSPLTLLTWNAQGLCSRLKEAAALSDIAEVVRRAQPDVIGVTEVKVKAHAANAATAMESSGLIKQARPDKRHEKELHALTQPPFDEYEVSWSLDITGYNGTCMLIKRSLGVRLDQVRYDLSTATAASSSSAGEHTVVAAPRQQHHPQGRVQFVQLHERGIDVLLTYSPNHGSTLERYAARERWDAEVRAFVAAHKKATARPLVWMGDLNVAHTLHDSTHEKFFREYWPKEQRVKGGSLLYPSREAYLQATPPEHRGIPSLSDSERHNFSDILATGGLADAWRELHPPVEPHIDGFDSEPRYTWRGAPRRDYNQFGARFEGKAQRIDYFCVSQHLMPLVHSCEILGTGNRREDNADLNNPWDGFMGSDHCPVLLELTAKPKACDQYTRATKAISSMAKVELLDGLNVSRVIALSPTSETLVGRDTLSLADKRVSRTQLTLSLSADHGTVLVSYGSVGATSNPSYTRLSTESAPRKLERDQTTALPSAAMIFLSQDPVTLEFQYPLRVVLPRRSSKRPREGGTKESDQAAVEAARRATADPLPVSSGS